MNNNTHVYGNMINIYIVLTILTLYSSINIILSTSMRGGIEIPKKKLANLSQRFFFDTLYN